MDGRIRQERLPNYEVSIDSYLVLPAVLCVSIFGGYNHFVDRDMK